MNKLNSKWVTVIVVALIMVFAVTLTTKAQGLGFWDSVADKVAVLLAGNVDQAPLGEMSFGAGTRLSSGLSADGTSPSAGEVRGTTLTFTSGGTLGGFASTSADFAVSGGTLDLSTTTPTTTFGLFVRTSDVATSTLGVGDVTGDGKTGCIEMVRGDGTYARAIIDGTSWNILAGRCVPTD